MTAYTSNRFQCTADLNLLARINRSRQCKAEEKQDEDAENDGYEEIQNDNDK